MKMLCELIQEQWPSCNIKGREITVGGNASCVVHNVVVDSSLGKIPCYGLSKVFVRPERRHEGIGTFLIEEVFTLCPDKPIVAFIKPELAEFYAGWTVHGFVDGKLLVSKFMSHEAHHVSTGGATW